MPLGGDPTAFEVKGGSDIDVPKNRVTPYGLREMPSLVERASHHNPPEMKKRALLLLEQKLRSTIDLASALSAGLIDALVKHFSDRTMVLYAVRCLAQVAYTDMGSRALAETGGENMLENLLRLFSDRSQFRSKLRASLLDLFVRLSANSKRAPLQMVNAGYVDELLEEVRQSGDVKEHRWKALETLHQCCREEAGSMQAIAGRCVPLCISQIKEHQDFATIKAASLTLAANTYGDKGKRQGLAFQIVDAICPILIQRADGDAATVASLCSALANVAVLNEAKRQVLAHDDAVASILRLLDNNSDQVQLCALKLVTLLVDHPDIRGAANCDTVLERLDELIKTSDRRIISKLATTARKRVLWKP